MQRNSNRKSRSRRYAVLTVSAVVAALVALVSASTAVATPKGVFAEFADCPLSNPEVVVCLHATTESGSFTVGKKTVPLEKPVVLQGGLKETPPEGVAFVAAADGNTLSKTPQKVPGGLSGLVNCTEIKGSGLLEKLERGTCESIFENGLTGVTATTELAAPASSIGVNVAAVLTGEGIALSLPIKVHLENPLLGSSCYIGSNSSPIVIGFTTGTTSPPLPNKPITGSPGTLEFPAEGFLRLSHNSLVNNSFAAPKTNGCGGIFEFLIGPIINSQLGVPSSAGHNTAILNGTLDQASVEAVKASE